MGAIAGPLMMAGGLALDIQGQRIEGKEIKKQAYWAAQERLYAAKEVQSQASAARAITQEKLHDLAVESAYARGSARAMVASAGVKATGSARTLLNKITASYARKKELLSMESSARTMAAESQARGYRREAYELMRRGKHAKKAGRWGMFSSLLTGGYTLGKEMGWFEKSA